MYQKPKVIATNSMRPEDAIEGPWIRRLCICLFQCPLCEQDHQADLYISMPATGIDEYVDLFKQHAADWTVLEPILTKETILFHSQEGDLPKLAQRLQLQGFPELRPPTIRLTEESEYTCTKCSGTFDTIAELRRHLPNCR